jgi:cytoskeletal protein CcmA (bactofilin family)
MFSKGNKRAPASNNSDGARSALKTSVPSIISADLRINGDLICSGDVQVDGWVEGDIQSRNIVIGEGRPCMVRSRPRPCGSAAW